jgi:hypothetical protein
VRNGDRAGRNDCAAFHPEAYVRGRLADGFEVLDRLRGGSFGGLAHQDAYLLRKPAAAAGAAATA